MSLRRRTDESPAAPERGLVIIDRERTRMRLFKRSGCCVLVVSCLLIGLGCDSGGIQPGMQKSTDNGLSGMPKSSSDLNAIKRTAKTSTGGMTNPPK